MRETRMKGKFTGGRVNYGYSCHEQKLSVIDEEAAVLLEIFTDYANGKSLTDIRPRYHQPRKAVPYEQYLLSIE